MRSRIWAWMVTSRAVVGSSAMSSLGSQASAMAIITRWRRPPDSSWGYWSSRSSGWGISTRRRTSRARSRACCRLTSRWSSTPSAICRPMVMVGLSEVIGSWGMRATSSPRTWRISFSSRPARSRPSSVTDPPVRWPLLGRSRMIDRPVVLLPQPGLADHPDALALVDVEGDAVDRHHRAVAQPELGAQVAQLQDRGHRRSVAGRSPGTGSAPTGVRGGRSSPDRPVRR